MPEPVAPKVLPSLAGEHPGREVVFDGVRFAYRTGGEVLPRFDLTIPAGRTVAVVGSTGAGKSTLAKLLARFYDPTEGRVLLDGTDLRDLATAELRRGEAIDDLLRLVAGIDDHRGQDRAVGVVHHRRLVEGQIEDRRVHVVEEALDRERGLLAQRELGAEAGLVRAQQAVL